MLKDLITKYEIKHIFFERQCIWSYMNQPDDIVFAHRSGIDVLCILELDIATKCLISVIAKLLDSFSAATSKIHNHGLSC